MLGQVKNTIPGSKFEDLMSFIKWSSHGASRRVSQGVGCTRWKVFIERKVWQGIFSKRKERMIFRPGTLFFLLFCGGGGEV